MINEYLKIKEIGVLDEPLKLCYHYLEKLTIAQNKYFVQFGGGEKAEILKFC